VQIRCRSGSEKLQRCNGPYIEMQRFRGSAELIVQVQSRCRLAEVQRCKVQSRCRAGTEQVLNRVQSFRGAE
jgi:glutathione peroxidase-family protein